MSDKLSKLVDQLEKIEDKIDRWYEKNIEPRLKECNNAEDVRKIIREISYQCCNSKGESRDMPSSIHIKLCCEISKYVV